MKKGVLLTLLAFVFTVASAQVRSTIAVENGERWWGGFTGLGSKMPFVKMGESYDFARQNLANQASPLFVSSYGRYMFVEEPARWSFDGKSFVFDAPTKEVVAVKVGKNLREAFVIAVDKHLKPIGDMPPAVMFSRAQFNTWIEMTYNQNQADIEAYAKAIVDNGFKPGVFIIDDNWQQYYGNFDFAAHKFPNPKAMIDYLHSLGFKVMVWVCPFVSADSPQYRELEAKRYLVSENGVPRISRWWNGASAVYDLLNESAFAHLEQQLKSSQQKYGFDGFKFDAGDVQFYDERSSNAQAAAWQAMANKFTYSELRSAWGGGAQRAVQRLSDKDYSWDALRLLVGEMTAAGVLGYPYTCPDMIGGGQYGSFAGVNRDSLDQTLIVRWTQASALMPMMQFSVAPWRVLTKENLAHVVDATELHEQMAPYIIELATEASKTGEPIVRSMEYMFPKQGFSDCNDQFMLGNRYLVAPILDKDNNRTVRLPRGVWTDDKGKRFRGPLVIEVTAPLGRLPYYKLK